MNKPWKKQIMYTMVKVHGANPTTCLSKGPWITNTRELRVSFFSGGIKEEQLLSTKMCIVSALIGTRKKNTQPYCGSTLKRCLCLVLKEYGKVKIWKPIKVQRKSQNSKTTGLQYKIHPLTGLSWRSTSPRLMDLSINQLSCNIHRSCSIMQ